MGSNMAEAHPVGFQWVMEAKSRGTQVVHIDPRFTRTSALADRHVPRPSRPLFHDADGERCLDVGGTAGLRLAAEPPEEPLEPQAVRAREPTAARAAQRPMREIFMWVLLPMGLVCAPLRGDRWWCGARSGPAVSSVRRAGDPRPDPG